MSAERWYRIGKIFYLKKLSGKNSKGARGGSNSVDGLGHRKCTSSSKPYNPRLEDEGVSLAIPVVFIAN